MCVLYVWNCMGTKVPQKGRGGNFKYRKPRGELACFESLLAQ